jgi:flagellar hook-associated protein 3 FlgL
MKASSVSSSAISEAMRYSLMKTQSALVKAQKEQSTGFFADRGLALGARTAQSVGFNRELERIKGIVDSNALATTRLTATQLALDQVATAAQSLFSTLTTAASGGQKTTVRDAATDMLKRLTASLNTSVNGEYIFAGINTDVKPINDFFADGSTSKAAYDNAYAQYLTDTGADPANPFPTAADMENFTDNYMQPLFMGPGWSEWSNASDQRIVSRISLNETSETSASANNDGLRKIAMAAAMVSQLMSGNLSEEASNQLVKSALSMVGSGLSDIVDLRSQTGIIEKRVTDASERLGQQGSLLEQHILATEGVDPYEVATRINDLVSHIETSYALTARLQNLRLLNFLS